MLQQNNEFSPYKDETKASSSSRVEIEQESTKCTHELKRREMVFYSCDCFHIRYYPSMSVENLVHYYNWERGMNRRQALEHIVNFYTKIGNNNALVENAKHKLLGTPKELD